MTIQQLPNTRQLPLWAAMATALLGVLTPSHAADFNETAITHIEYPGWFNDDPFNDLSELTAQSAQGEKKGVMVFFTTEGCSYCDHFVRTSLADPSIAKQVQTHFESVGMEIFDDAEMYTPSGDTASVKQFAKNENVQFAPTLLFYDNQGKRVLHKTGYVSPERFRTVLDYVTGSHYQTASLRDFSRQRPAKDSAPIPASAALIPDPLFASPPYALDRSRFAASKPLLVIFEQQACAECEDFHREVLSQASVRDTLAQFDVVRLDAQDTDTPVLAPDGSKTTPAQWYESTAFSRTPALAFYDQKGQPALATDALVLPQRMMNSLNFVLQNGHEKGWIYQRFARSEAQKRLQQNQADASSQTSSGRPSQ